MVEKSTFASEDDPPLVYATVAPTAPLLSVRSDWSCPKCTLLNPISKQHCDACYFPRSHLPVSFCQAHGASQNPPDTPPTLPVIGVTSVSNHGYDSRNGFHDHLDISSPKSNSLSENSTRHPNVIIESPTETGPLAVNILEARAEEDPFHKKIRRRLRRKRRMAAGGIAGCIVGSVFLCFPGAIIGAIAGALGARALSKRREHLKDQRLAKEWLSAAEDSPDGK